MSYMDKSFTATDEGFISPVRRHFIKVDADDSKDSAERVLRSVLIAATRLVFDQS